MTRRTQHQTAHRSRTGALLAATVAVALGTALSAPYAFGEPAAAPPAEAGATATQTLATGESPQPDESVERGVVVAGTGTLDGRKVSLEIYANDRFGSHVSVAVEQHGGPELVGHVELLASDLLDGDVDVDVPLDRATRGGLVDTRHAAAVSGSWTGSGPATAVDETYEDAGYVIRTTGWNTPLDVRLTVTVEGQAVVVDVHDAFAFDLTVTRTPA